MSRKSHLLFVVPVILALASAAFAQDNPASDCRIRVLVLKHKWVDNGTRALGVLSENQSNWWKDNAGKFPGVCLVDTEPADYVLAWTETRTFVPYTTSVPVTTTHSETVRTDSGRTARYETRQQVWNHWWVDARLFKVDAGKLQNAAVFEAKHHGRWSWSKPDKDAFSNALKALSKQTKNK